ncbi:beta-lactamase family protein [Planctomycetaceae bacterium]|nr:beta-lactamase family protein [Planctomycetaceae bacterium]
MTDWDSFENTLRVIELGAEKKLHRGIQIYVSHNGETLLDTAWGDQGDADTLLSEHVMLWLSSGKPLTAVALGVLKDRGLIRWDDSLSQFIPEWAMFSQPEATLSQLLTHTAGFENRDLGWPENQWESIVSEVMQRPLPSDWPVGEKAGYVVAASWFLLGEVICRLTLQDFPTTLRQLVLDPLGMKNSFCGLSQDEMSLVEPKLGRMFGRTPHGLEDLNWNQGGRVMNPAPGGNCRGPIRELGKFYESLLPNSATNLLSNETANQLTTRQRVGMYDQTFRHKIDWGYGFIVNSNCYGGDSVPYGFGRYSGESTFGHGGSQSSIGFADPEHGVVVAWVANGRVGEPRHHERNLAINDAIYLDLGLAAKNVG